jgi:hypothetical protein
MQITESLQQFNLLGDVLSIVHFVVKINYHMEDGDQDQFLI